MRDVCHPFLFNFSSKRVETQSCDFTEKYREIVESDDTAKDFLCEKMSL